MSSEICSKCKGTGWYQYDHNHSTVCNQCCDHKDGWWLLQEGYSSPGKYACGKGCGKTLSYKQALTFLKTNYRKYSPIFLTAKESD